MRRDLASIFGTVRLRSIISPDAEIPFFKVIAERALVVLAVLTISTAGVCE